MVGLLAMAQVAAVVWLALVITAALVLSAVIAPADSAPIWLSALVGSIVV